MSANDPKQTSRGHQREALSCDRSWNAFAKSEGQRRRASYQGPRQPQQGQSDAEILAALDRLERDNPAKVDADVMAVVMGEIRKSIVLK